MKKAVLFATLVLLISCQSVSFRQKDASKTQLVLFDSDESMERLSRSNAKIDFFSLANQFEAQSNAIFCGPTSATIVLNAMRSKQKTKLPKDKIRLNRINPLKLPASIDLSLPRYTQENVVAKSPKKLSHVFGKKLSIDGRKMIDPGYQLRDFNALLKAHGLKTKLRVVDANISEDDVLAEMISNLKERHNYVIINYLRTAVGQKGGGHISPVGAYDKASNSFLILDVNPAKASWVWMPASKLLQGMRTFDQRENRGYILVEDRLH